MCVVAHPDDECFGFGGALALAADRGIETSVLCMTDGQAATHRGSAESGLELGASRRREFAASCEVLGVTEHEVLGYHDGQLQNVPVLEAVEHLVRRMR
jgi:LmbE family N-acetylglucosaminyl deacetylase